MSFVSHRFTSGGRLGRRGCSFGTCGRRWPRGSHRNRHIDRFNHCLRRVDIDTLFERRSRNKGSQQARGTNKADEELHIRRRTKIRAC